MNNTIEQDFSKVSHVVKQTVVLAEKMKNASMKEALKSANKMMIIYDETFKELAK